MGKGNRKKARKQNLQRKSENLEQRKEGLVRERKLVFSLALLDSTQGENYEDWQKDELLAKAMTRFQALCSMTAEQAKREQHIKEYDEEIPTGSAFVRPKHIPEGVRWASIRIQAKVRIIGYLEENYIFHLVFLDKEHLFYPSSKKTLDG